MVIVVARVTTAPGKRDEFVAAAQDCIRATRQEEGCISYELLAMTDHPDKLMYFERWVDKAALKRHMQTPHMDSFAKVKEERGLQSGDIDLAIFNAEE